MLLVVFMVVIFAVWVYILFIRPKLIASYPAYSRFAEIETALYQKSRTILVSRLYWIGGIIIGIQSLASSAGLDASPFIDQLARAVPETYRPLAITLFLFLTGIAFEWLRRTTAAPIGEDKDED